MKLRHAPVVQEFSAAHGVAEMRLPTVVGIHIAHGGGDAAFGHDGVRFAEQRFADDANARALRERFDGGAQSGAAGADDQYVVFVGLVFGWSQDPHVLDRAGWPPGACKNRRSQRKSSCTRPKACGARSES